LQRICFISGKQSPTIQMSLRRKKLFLALFSFFYLANHSSAQYNEMGVMAGVSNYKGELSPHLFNKDFLHFAAGVFYRHNWNRHWSYKFELNYGNVSGDDAKAQTAYERNRNLSFYSEILEFSPLIEFNFFPYETANSQFPFSPYLFTGLTVFQFNPKATLNGTEYELQPLSTEAQDPYGRIVIALPIGGGLKISLGPVGLGIEVGARRTYTDYLDDVSTVYPDPAKLNGPVAVQLSDRSIVPTDPATSLPHVAGKQRGNPQDNDWYLFAGITFYVRMTSPMKDSCKPFKLRRY
jgi:hypothetical protein